MACQQSARPSYHLIEHVQWSGTVVAPSSVSSPGAGSTRLTEGAAAVRTLLPLFRAAPTALRRTFLVSCLHHWNRQGVPPDNLMRCCHPGSTTPICYACLP